MVLNHHNPVCHWQVAEAAVIGIPDPKWTERPLLVVVPKKGQASAPHNPTQRKKCIIGDGLL